MPRALVLLAASLFVLFPASVVLVESLAATCSSSSERFSRAMLLWGSAIAAVTVIALRRTGLPSVAAGLLLQLLVVAAAAIALPNLDFGSADRSHQKRTLAAMRAIAYELDAIRARDGAYPTLTSVEALQRLTKRKLSTTDGWSHPLRLRSTPAHYVITSHGLCGEAGGEDVRADVVLRSKN